ncbi:ATP-binding cassette domain-containing protein [Oscillibacter sp.]|uniref:ATP-binding cassette domain-containing protein n=1 Tax=Oscillibacter sp. TaxID=1945593 RepID=UPI0037C829B2
MNIQIPKAGLTSLIGPNGAGKSTALLMIGRLLDEPLNNLDVARSVQMMKHLRYAADEFGRTILTVMHDINFVAKYSDKICAMKNGKIAAFGTVAEIMNAELLTDIFETQINIIDGPTGPIAIY